MFQQIFTVPSSNLALNEFRKLKVPKGVRLVVVATSSRWHLAVILDLGFHTCLA